MTPRLLLALTAVYVIWGSTYFAIGHAVAGLPPFFAAALRFLPAGLLLLAFGRLRGRPWPERRHWVSAIPIGLLLLTGGNGLVCLGAQQVPSGLTAVLIAITPVVIVGIPWLLGGPRPGIRTLCGIALGIVGVALLARHSSLETPLLSLIAIFGACLSWATAVLLMPHLPQPEDLLDRSALPMLTGGAALAVLAFATGERPQSGPHLATALFATAYLIVFGSIVAFTSYLWLQRAASPALATSNVYVNPVVAVALGSGLGGEPFGLPLVLGSLVILSAVMLLWWDQSLTAPTRPFPPGPDTKTP